MKTITPLLLLLAGLSAFPSRAEIVITTSFSNTGFPIDTSADLISSLVPAKTGGIDIPLATLVDGVAGIWPGMDATIHDGATLTWDLGGPATLNEIITCSGWGDGGRSRQDYTVDVSTDGYSWTYALATVANAGPAPTSPSDVQVSIKNSDNSPLATDARYVRFNFPRTQNGGVGYTEFVLNGVSSVPPEAPNFVTEPFDTLADLGSPLTLNVEVTGFPTPLITWHFLKDGVDTVIPGQNGTSLTISMMEPSDEGEYYAMAANKSGSATSAHALVTVVMPPPEQAPIVQIVETKATTFSLDTTGDILLGLLAPEQASPGLTDGTAANVPPGGAYYEGDNNKVQTFALGAPATINRLEVYSGWPNSDRVNQYYTVSISKDNGATYTELYQVSAVVDFPFTGSRSSVLMRVQLVPNGSDVLATGVDHIRFSFRGAQYGMVGYNEIAVFGKSEVELEAPQITTDLPAETTAFWTLPLTLTVDCTANPAPTYQWYKNDNIIPGANSKDLAFPVVEPEIAGHYKVVLQNSQGSAESTTTTVTVVNPPAEQYPILMDVTTKHYSFDPIDTANDLIKRVLPVGYTSGQIIHRLDYDAPVDRLTDGYFGAYIPMWVGVPVNNGNSFTFALQAPSDVTEIVSYSGWLDGGRCDVDYSVSVSTDGGTSYTALYTVAAKAMERDQNPLNTRVRLIPNDSPLLASGVTHVRFDFQNLQNGGIAISELVIKGTPAPAPGPQVLITSETSRVGFQPDTNSDLILGVAPTITGNYNLPVAWLTDGLAPGPGPGGDGGIHNQTTLTWDLGKSSTISKIITCTAWGDPNRCRQDYSVDVSGDGTNWFLGLAWVSALPAPTNPSDVMVTLTMDNGSPLSTEARFVRFNFPWNQYDMVAYTEFIITGSTGARLYYTLADGALTLSWKQAGYQLQMNQGSLDPAGWQPVPEDTAELTEYIHYLDPAQPQVYFRLVGPQ